MRVAVLGAYALLALIVIPIYPHFVSPNEFTRWAFDVAVLDHHSIEVTSVVAPFGPRFEDVSVRDGRVYSNKAPGTALLTLPAHAVARIFSNSLRFSLTAMRLAASTLPVLITGLLLYRLAKRKGIAPARADVVVWMLLFATPLFAYGLLMFAHALVAMALFGAWLLLEEDRYVLAGALTGLAVAAEYTMVFAAAILFVVVCRNVRNTVRFVGGGLPFAILLGAYHAAAFGSAFANPYTFSKEYRALHQSGLFGLHVPDVVTAGRILVDPTYGLFVFSPVLLLGILAIGSVRAHLPSRQWWTMLLIPLVLWVVYAGYPYWYGGWNVSARFLVPAIPFLIVPMLFRAPSRLEAILAGGSAAAVALTTLVFPFVPEGFALPWRSLALPLLARGLVVPNVFHWIARPLAIVTPFAIVIAAAVIALGWRRSALAAAGAVLMIAIGFAWTPKPVLNLLRDYVAEVYFERAGSMQGSVPPGLLRRRAYEQQLPPADWPF